MTLAKTAPIRRARPPLFLLVALVAALLAAPAQAREIYVANSGDGTVSVVESSSNAVVATVPIGGTPVDVAIAPRGGRAYVVDEARDAVFAIDTATRQVSGAAVEVGAGPRAIAITPSGGHAYVSNSQEDTVTVINLAAQVPIATIPLGAEAEPEGIAIAPDGATAFVAQKGGDVALITTATNLVTRAVDTPVGMGPSRISLDTSGTRGFVTNSNSNSVSVVNTISATVLGAPLIVGTNPAGIAVNPNGPRTYAAARSADSVVAIDTAAHQTVGFPVGGFASPTGVAVAPDGTLAYVTNQGGSHMTILETLGNLPIGGVEVGTAPQGLAVVPNQGPTASFAVASARRDAGAPVVFDAASSSDPDGGVALYSWEFGDGEAEITASPAVEHVFAKPGLYGVRLTVADVERCSTALLFTGQTVSCNGSQTATLRHWVSVRDATPPDFRLGGLRRQRLSRRVTVVGRCPQERCQMIARGFGTSVLTKRKRTVKKRAKTRRGRVELANGVERRVRLRLPGRFYRAARRALTAGGRATVKVRAEGRDAAGNKRRRTMRVSLYIPRQKKKQKQRKGSR